MVSSNQLDPYMKKKQELQALKTIIYIELPLGAKNNIHGTTSNTYIIAVVVITNLIRAYDRERERDRVFHFS